MDLSKYVKSESEEISRSALHLAEYNPRSISQENLKALKRGIKKYGLVGGIVVNKRTGYTVVGGHQRIAAMDDLQKYDSETKKNDYMLRVDVIDIDEKAEKELNVLLNNPNAQGSWDFDKLRELIPDIEYKDAGLTEADLSMIGCDYLFKTEQEDVLNEALTDMMAEVNEEHRQEVEQRKEQRRLNAEAETEADGEDDDESEQILDSQARIDHVKEVKQQQKEKAETTARNMHAYVTLSFSSFEAKSAFCERFGYEPYDEFIKGEDFEERLEFANDEDGE